MRASIPFLILAVCSSITLSKKVLWWDDFESFREGQTNISTTGGGPGPYDRQQNCQCYHYPKEPRCKCSAETGKNSHIIVTDPAFCGRQSLRMERNNGDAYPKHSGSSARNELVTPKMWNPGDDVWIGFALYLCSKGYGANGKWRNPPRSNKTLLICQVTNGGGPTFGLRINWDKDGGNYYLHLGVKTLGEVPLPWDEWIKVVIHMHWLKIGPVEVYQNGKKILQRKEDFPQRGYSKFKIGQYGNTAAVGYPQIAFIDNLKIAVGSDLLDEVDPACTGGTTSLVPDAADRSQASRKPVNILHRLVGGRTGGMQVFSLCGRRMIPSFRTTSQKTDQIGIYFQVPGMDEE